MRIAAMLLWLIVPVAGYAAHQTWGSPHMLYAYQMLDNGDRYNLAVPRHYTSCSYIGWRWHQVTVPARAGRCPFIRAFHFGADQ